MSRNRIEASSFSLERSIPDRVTRILFLLLLLTSCGFFESTSSQNTVSSDDNHEMKACIDAVSKQFAALPQDDKAYVTEGIEDWGTTVNSAPYRIQRKNDKVSADAFASAECTRRELESSK